MKLWIVALVSVLFAASSAFAHDVEKGPNGGRVVEAGAYHVELVINEKTVKVFVTDSAEKPVAVTGFKGLAILTVNGKAHRVALEPMESIYLSAISLVALTNEVRGVVQLTSPDGKIAQGRFH